MSTIRAVTPSRRPPPRMPAQGRPLSTGDHRRAARCASSSSATPSGQTLGRGLELWGDDTGARNRGERRDPMCSLGRDLPRRAPARHGRPTAAACCRTGRDRWPQTIDTFDPDVVVVLYSVWEAEARKLPSGRFAQPGDPRARPLAALGVPGRRRRAVRARRARAVARHRVRGHARSSPVSRSGSSTTARSRSSPRPDRPCTSST